MVETMNTWLVADWHFGEQRFEIMQRPFSSTEEHDRCIGEKHNAVVAPDDFVIMIGDAVSKSAKDPLASLDLINSLNGDKWLIRGNHDSQFTYDQLIPYFKQVIVEGGGLEWNVTDETAKEDNKPVHGLWLTHYPTQGRSDMFNIVGHVHGAWKFQLNMINVGVDVNYFSPTPASKIPFYINAIKNFYDLDIWASYSDINQKFWETRGKKTRYFTSF